MSKTPSAQTTPKSGSITWVDGVPTPDAQEYAARRARLFALLPENAALIVVSSPEVLRNGADNAYTYRQNSDMLYLSGFPEADSVAVLKKTTRMSRFALFVNRQDRESELWHGKRIGIEAAKTNFGADRAFAVTTLGGNLGKLLGAGVEHVYFATGNDRKLEAKIEAVLARLGLKVESTNLLAGLRLIKSEAELAIMYRAAHIAAFAHHRAMRSCAPGLAESDLKAEIEYVFTANGNACPSYDTIVAGGPNGLSLHHPAGRSLLEDGHLVLVDAGCEVSGYASDVTRTFPVNGRFSQAQREIYELVLEAQMAAIEAIKPGVTLRQWHAACDSVLTAGLKRLGFSEKVALHEVFPHGLGHWLGLDVHDVGESYADLTMAVGMVITVEPGLYLGLDDKRIPEQYRGIAIRIEDDVAVTANGASVLTRDTVKTVAGIEALMAGL